MAPLSRSTSNIATLSCLSSLEATLFSNLYSSFVSKHFVFSSHFAVNFYKESSMLATYNAYIRHGKHHGSESALSFHHNIPIEAEIWNENRAVNFYQTNASINNISYDSSSSSSHHITHLQMKRSMRIHCRSLILTQWGGSHVRPFKQTTR